MEKNALERSSDQKIPHLKRPPYIRIPRGCILAGISSIAKLQGKAINALAAEIDEARDLETGLATAIRLFVLRSLQDKLRANGG